MKTALPILIFSLITSILNAQQTKTMTVVEFFLKTGNYTFFLEESDKSNVAFVKKTNSRVIEKYDAKGKLIKNYSFSSTDIRKYNDFINNQIKESKSSIIYLDQQPFSDISDACEAFIDKLTDNIGGGLISVVVACKQKLCTYVDSKSEKPVISKQ